MNPFSRQIKESPLYQGHDEILAYCLLTTPWASGPASPVVVLKNDAGVDVSATYLAGSPSVSGDIITTPLVTGLVEDVHYRLEIKWVVGSAIYEAWSDMYGER